MRVTSLTGGLDLPSTRFRVRQHIPGLARRGVSVRESVPRIDKHAQLPGATSKSRLLRWPVMGVMHGFKIASRAPEALATYKTDLTWVLREMVKGVPSLELVVRRPFVFDVDDAIWLAPPAGSFACARIAERAEVVMAGNAYLAEWFSRHAKDVRIVPTAVDPVRYAKVDERDREKFVIGWIGTSSNLKYLHAIEDGLKKTFDEHPEAEMLIVCNAPPEFSQLDPNRVRFVPWSREVEVDMIRDMDVGLMPLADDPWARGKCSYKMLQYMSCALPSVVSPVGMNVDVLASAELGFGASTSDEWADALITYAKDRALARRHGEAGRKIVEETYALDVVTEQIAGIFRGAA